MLPLLAACTDDPAAEAVVEVRDVVVTVDPVYATVLHVSWSTSAPTTGLVRFGEGALDRTTAVSALATDHTASLLGLPPGTAIELQVAGATEEGVEVQSEVTSAATNLWGPELPNLTVTGAVESWTGGFLALSTVGTASWALILDDQARVVWARAVEVGDSEDLMRVRLTRDGSAILILVAGHHTDDGLTNRILKVNLDGSGEEILDWPYLDHDVVEQDDGALVGIVRAQRGEYWADDLVERAADGTFRTIYSTWDDEALDLTEDNQLDGELTHSNALDYDAATDAFYLNISLLQMLVLVDRASGQATQHYYGIEAEWSTQGTDPLTSSHQFQVLGEGHILHFENGGGSRASSMARELKLDLDTHTYEEIWSYEADPALYVFAKGDVERFDDGGTEVLWATAGRVEDLDANDASVWQLDLDLGYAFTYFQHVDRLGP